MGRVQGKCCLVSGGAKGLGEATAQLLAREGAKVLVTDVDEKIGRQTAEVICSAGGEASFHRHDVTKEADWRDAIQACRSRYGRLDVLVNNAGVADEMPLDKATIESWRRLMSINLDGVFLGTKHALVAMGDQEPKGGSIINLSSVLGIVGDPDSSAYCASKGGVRLYTKSVALFCARHHLNVRVNSVHPGYIRTPLVEGFLRDGRDYEKGLKRLGALHPIGHIGEALDVAYGVLYLASDESKFVTGAELVIDVGYSAQ